VSLRLWRAPQPYFKLRFCSLIAFGPDCSHFPSAIPNMRENGADLVSAVCEACRGQSRRQRRRHARQSRERGTRPPSLALVGTVGTAGTVPEVSFEWTA
jgi:hypothetical protein